MKISIFQTEKDTRSDSSDETLSSTDDSIRTSSPARENMIRSCDENHLIDEATGNSVDNDIDQLLSNHEKAQ